MRKKTFFSLLGMLLILSLFIIVSYFTQENLPYIQGLISNTFVGMGAYFLIVILETVLAPITIIPLIPLATGLWGWFLAGLLTLIGWTFGSLLAFFIARKGGVPLIERFVPLKKIQKVEKLILEEHLFIGIILLRILIPIDVVSYAIGLFSSVSWKKYTLASFIGFIPLSFFLAYSGSLPVYYQLMGFLLMGILILLVLIILIKRIMKKLNIVDLRELFT
ncbi:MAG: VTT domain-containing protein [Nanoarchaeota archaeon]|nr:VTT domain-containing protein [Nanoarchaeota archaeon]